MRIFFRLLICIRSSIYENNDINVFDGKRTSEGEHVKAINWQAIAMDLKEIVKILEKNNIFTALVNLWDSKENMEWNLANLMGNSQNNDYP